MKKYKLATVLLSASLALSACGSDSEKEESKNDSEEATSAAASAPIHKKDTSDESKAAKTTGNLPDKEQQALDAALLMFTHAKNKNFNAFKNDMELRSKFSRDIYQSEPADSEYKEIMVNWATLNYADFNLKVIDWDKLSDATQIEIGEDYGGDSVLVSVTTKDDTLTQEEKEGMDIVLIMNKYNNRYMMKEFKAADIIQDDINEQMYAGNATVVKNTESEDSNDSDEIKEEKSSEIGDQKLTSDQQNAINKARKFFSDAEAGNLEAFKADNELMMKKLQEIGDSEGNATDEDFEGMMNIYAAIKYIDNYKFKAHWEGLSTEFKTQLTEEFGEDVVPVSITNTKDTLSKEILDGQGKKAGDDPRWEHDMLFVMVPYNGDYELATFIRLDNAHINLETDRELIEKIYDEKEIKELEAYKKKQDSES
ncbi:hypothetical protein [Priestia megaterium]